MITLAVKMSSHSGIAIAFDVKNVALESISDSIIGLSHMLYMASVAF